MRRVILVVILAFVFALCFSIPLSKTEAASETHGIFPGMIIGYDSDGSLTYYSFCDGTAGTPDLQDRVPIGAGDTYNLGDTGGATTHAHSYYGTGVTSFAADIIMEGGNDYRAVAAPTTVTAGTTDSETILPPYCAIPFWQVANYTQGVPDGAIVWWDDIVGNIPTGWSVYTPLVNKFAIGSGNTYNRGDASDVSTHQHIFSIAGTFTLSVGPGGFKAYVAGQEQATTGTFTGAGITGVISHVPLYYGLIPIENTSGGTRGVTTNMVLLFNAAIGTLPTGYSELTAARNRYVVGASDTYSVDESAGSADHDHTWSGSGSAPLSAGTRLNATPPTGNLHSAGTAVVSGGMHPNVNNDPPYHALFWIKKD